MKNLAELCKGSTADSDSVCLGSNPSSAAIEESLPSGRLFFYLWHRNYDLRSQTYDRSLPSPRAKLADYAYRREAVYCHARRSDNRKNFGRNSYR